ncbi:hypothetical protein GMA19_00838 [Paenibacillus polymyxa E681]|uniref:hypothetical protein n=1 Tax=Paenibacillus polymyxa TaxID=1406 RepID=UPI0002E7AFA5|nr:hypothetical protein [Paenibacillus polymyxa]AJW69137.1 hypothetical protein PPE_05270 [Paenibacillus polymyxa E681]QNV55686.1 hypothetical protein GE561_00839 [Paenibacillus polymyxa E681]QNV60522.1 hypothetical protein GMA19_00838 [Paenibacillus polymyxa E681]
MSNWPDWFQEALRQRFYQLELASEQNASCSSEDKNLSTQMDQFKINQNEDIQRLLSEWSERRDSIDPSRHTTHSYSLVY